MKRVAWHIRTGTMMGRKSRFLLSRGCHWKQDRLASYLQEISLLAPHSLPFSSIRGTDVPGSQYKYILRFHYSTKVGQAQNDPRSVAEKKDMAES